MPSQTIQWFPGHMAKTRRLISENIKNVDIVIEILDARIPYSSKNPEIARLTAAKPTILLLNKAGLADPVQTKRWAQHYTDENTVCITTDCLSGSGIEKIPVAVKGMLEERLKRYEEKGMSGRKLKAMVLGIPNVGKSSFVNKIAGNKKAKVENRPGVTLDKQWISTSIGIDLMDMPGVLWPKFEDKSVGENLALTGAIKDAILDVETLAVILCARLKKLYPELLANRYKLSNASDLPDMDPYDLFLLIGKKRGFLISGGEIDTERTANVLLEEFRSGKIGAVTLDLCEKEN